MIWFYFLSFLFFTLSNFAHFKTSRSIGMQPLPGTAVYHMYSWFGGGLSTLAIVALIVWGFFAFSWWTPLIVLFGSLFGSGLVYGAIPLGETHVLIGFPVGCIFALIALFGFA